MAELTPVQIERSLTRGRAGGASTSRSVSFPRLAGADGDAGDFVVGGAVREVGAELTDISAQLQRAKRVQDVAGASAAIQGEMGALEEASRQATIQDPLERGAHFRAALDARIAEVVQELPTGTQALVRERLAGVGRTMERTLRTEGRQAFVGTMRETFNLLIDQAHTQHVQAQSPEEAAIHLATLRDYAEEFVREGAITEAEKIKALGAFEKQADISRAMLRIQVHPELMEEHLTRLSSGEPGIGVLPSVSDPDDLSKLLGLAQIAARQQRKDRASQEDEDEKVFAEEQAQAATELRARLFVIPPTSDHADQLRAFQKEVNADALTEVIDEADHAQIGRMTQAMLTAATNPAQNVSDESTFETLTIGLYSIETPEDIDDFEADVLASADLLTGRDIGGFLRAAETRRGKTYSTLPEVVAARRLLIDQVQPKGIFAEDDDRFALSNALVEYDARMAGHAEIGLSEVRKFARPEVLSVIDAWFPSGRRRAGGVILPPTVDDAATEGEAAVALDALPQPRGLPEASWKRQKALYLRGYRATEVERQRRLERKGRKQEQSR